MVRAVDPTQTFPYVLARERGAENPTIFHLRAVTLKEREFLFRQQARAAAGNDKYDEACLMRDALRIGLEGWDGLLDQDGESEVPFVGGPNPELAKHGDRAHYATASSLQRIPLEFWAELMQAIISQSYINADDRKN